MVLRALFVLWKKRLSRRHANIILISICSHEVMFGLVHGIELLYQKNIEVGLRLIAISVPNIIRHASEWVAHPQVRLSYARVLSMLD